MLCGPAAWRLASAFIRVLALVQKYDIAEPTYKRWFCLGIRGGWPREGFSAVLMRRRALLLCICSLAAETAIVRNGYKFSSGAYICSSAATFGQAPMYVLSSVCVVS